MKVIVLNFESGEVDVLTIPKDTHPQDVEEYIQINLQYSLSNCEWMTVMSSVKINFIE